MVGCRDAPFLFAYLNGADSYKNCSLLYLDFNNMIFKRIVAINIMSLGKGLSHVTNY